MVGFRVAGLGVWGFRASYLGCSVRPEQAHVKCACNTKEVRLPTRTCDMCLIGKQLAMAEAHSIPATPSPKDLLWRTAKSQYFKTWDFSSHLHNNKQTHEQTSKESKKQTVCMYVFICIYIYIYLSMYLQKAANRTANRNRTARNRSPL